MSRHAHRSPSKRRALVVEVALVAVGALVVAGVFLWPRDDGIAVTSSPTAPSSAPSAAHSKSHSAQPSPTPTLSSTPPVVGAVSKAERIAKRLAKKTQKVVQADEVLRRIPPTTFRVSSFNVLGASHTVRGGTHGGFTDGATRMRWAVDLLNGAGIDVVGLQELQASQYNVFRGVAPGWGVFPGPALGTDGLANSIAWRTDVWELVESHTIDIPYFGGRPRPMPYLLLRNIESQQEVWFANTHNPADAHGPAQRWRNIAVAREVALVNALTADGTPVIYTGDMNDREEYFCPMTAGTTMHAANGGSTGTSCGPPDNMDVDWVMGSERITFTSFSSVRDGLINRTSDHPFVWAEATIAPPE